MAGQRKGDVIMTEVSTLYKLIILYMLHKVDFPLTTSQISEFILDKGYTNYFNLQQAISEAVESNLIRVESTHNRTLYHLTEEGAETISFFSNNISPEIRQDIDDFFKEKKYELKDETAVKADYYLNTNHEYSVHMQVVEDNLSLIDLTVVVPDEASAEQIVNKWNKNNQEIYAMIMAKLL